MKFFHLNYFLARRGEGESVETSSSPRNGLDNFHLFQRLDSALYHSRLFDVGSKAIDELFFLLNFLLLVLNCLAQGFLPSGALFQVEGVVAFVAVKIPQLSAQSPLGDRLQKRSVVRNNYQSALVALGVLFQPILRDDVEMIGRLIKNEERRLFE